MSDASKGFIFSTGYYLLWLGIFAGNLVTLNWANGQKDVNDISWSTLLIQSLNSLNGTLMLICIADCLSRLFKENGDES